MLMYFRSLSVMFIDNEATATTIAHGPNKNTTTTDCGRTDAAERQSADCRVRHIQEPTKSGSRCSRATDERYGRAGTKI